VAAALELDLDELGALPAVGLAPTGCEHVLQPPSGRLAKLVTAGDPHEQPLVHHFLVLRHVPFLLVAGLG
jgi:hypothetical protein